MTQKLVASRLFWIAVLFFAQTVKAQNSLSKKEAKEGWILLFDGNTTTGWRDAYKDTLPKGSWKLENGALHVLPKLAGDSTTTRGDIVTQKLYSNFELMVDFKMTEGTNSGIKYFVDNRALGLEYQIIDDQRHPDAKQGKNGNRTLSSLYDLIPAATKLVKPMGEWNTAKIVSNAYHVEHWLNGVLVLQYERGSEAFKAPVADSKYKTIPGFGLGNEGRILLQDHGDEVFFRNIKLREIKSPK